MLKETEWRLACFKKSYGMNSISERKWEKGLVWLGSVVVVTEVPVDLREPWEMDYIVSESFSQSSTTSAMNVSCVFQAYLPCYNFYTQHFIEILSTCFLYTVVTYTLYAVWSRLVDNSLQEP
jgi:hypothetical protein